MAGQRLRFSAAQAQEQILQGNHSGICELSDSVSNTVGIITNRDMELLYELVMYQRHVQ